MKCYYNHIYYTIKKGKRIPHIEEQHYDIFVTYADADLPWIKDILLPHEEKWQIKLCLKDQDFRCDVSIAETIYRAVRKTRKTLLVITESFVEDDCCYYSQQMALGNRLSHLVVVLLDDFDVQHPHANLLCAVMDKIPMITYIKENEKKSLRRLKQNLI